MMPDKEKYDDALKQFNEQRSKGCGAYDEYVFFSRFIHGIFIKNEGIKIGNENFREVNQELMYHIRKKVERHPRLFKWLFMVK